MNELTGKSTISKGTYHLFLGNLLSTLLLAITSIVVARLLGPDGFGLYTIILIIPGYAYTFLRWGLSSAITRFSTKYMSEGNEKRAISFSYTMSILHLAAGLLAIGLLIPFSNMISTYVLHRSVLSGGLVIPIALLSVVGQIMFNNGYASFVGLHEFRKSALFQIVMALSKLVASVFLVLIGYSVIGAIGGYTLGFIISGAASIGLLIWMNRGVIPLFLRESVKISFDYAPPIYFSNVVWAIVIPFQNTILAYFVSNQDIGWYSAAVNISILVTLFTFPISTSVLPLFSKSTPTGTRELSNTYKLALKYTSLLVTPITMFMMVLSNQLATAIYGSAYSFAGHYLVVVAAVNLLSGLGSITWGSFLAGVGETKKALIGNASGAGVSIVASVVLVFYAGVFGAIFGTLLGQLISLVVGSRYISHYLGEDLKAWFVWRIYLSSALSAGIIYPVSLLNLNPFLVIIIAGALFLLILLPVMAWSNALTEDDMNALREQFRGITFVSYLLNIIAKYHRLFARSKIHELQQVE